MSHINHANERHIITLRAKHNRATERLGRYLDRVGVMGEGPDHTVIMADIMDELNSL